MLPSPIMIPKNSARSVEHLGVLKPFRFPITVCFRYFPFVFHQERNACLRFSSSFPNPCLRYEASPPFLAPINVYQYFSRRLIILGIRTPLVSEILCAVSRSNQYFSRSQSVRLRGVTDSVAANAAWLIPFCLRALSIKVLWTLFPKKILSVFFKLDKSAIFLLYCSKPLITMAA